jgi:hypothetical protein
MLYAMFRAMLGPLNPILDWAEANPVYVAIPLFAWAMLWLYSKMALQRIETRTRQLVLDMGRDEMEKVPSVTAKALYKRVYPVWAASLSNWAWLIPNRLEFWPVRATPAAVEKKLKFSPQWIKKELADNGIDIKD